MAFVADVLFESINTKKKSIIFCKNKFYKKKIIFLGYLHQILIKNVHTNLYYSFITIN